MTDPLQELLVDEGAVARDELAQALRPYVQLGADGGLWLRETFDGLPARSKVLCLLLAIKAQSLLGLREADGAQPQELIDASGMAAGTVRPKLSELRKARLVAKSGNLYLVPDPVVRRAQAQLGGGS